MRLITILCILSCCFSLSLTARSEPIAIYVSQAGNDIWEGTSIDRPFATIQRARDKIRTLKSNGVLNSPVTVYIRGGEYRLSEPLIFNHEDSGGESSRINYTAYKGEEPIFITDKQDNGLLINQMVKFEGDPETGKYVEYIGIIGITFSGTKSSAAEEKSSVDARLLSQSGISLYYVRHFIFKNNIIRSINFPAVHIIGSDNKIIGNHISDISGGGICVQGNDFIISKNTIHDIYYADSEKPGWGICLDSASSNSIVENNIIARTGVGIHLRENNKDISIRNNIVVNTERSLVKLTKPKTQAHENIEIVKNIFYFNKLDVDLFYLTGNRSLPGISDNNVFWNSAGCIWLNPVIWGVGQVAYLKDWQALGFDQHSAVKDPLFEDLEHDDYSLKPRSPALKLGFKQIDSGHIQD